MDNTNPPNNNTVNTTNQPIVLRGTYHANTGGLFVPIVIDGQEILFKLSTMHANNKLYESNAQNDARQLFCKTLRLENSGQVYRHAQWKVIACQDDVIMYMNCMWGDSAQTSDQQQQPHDLPIQMAEPVRQQPATNNSNNTDGHTLRMGLWQQKSIPLMQFILVKRHIFMSDVIFDFGDEHMPQDDVLLRFFSEPEFEQPFPVYESEQEKILRYSNILSMATHEQSFLSTLQMLHAVNKRAFYVDLSRVTLGNNNTSPTNTDITIVLDPPIPQQVNPATQCISHENYVVIVDQIRIVPSLEQKRQNPNLEDLVVFDGSHEQPLLAKISLEESHIMLQQSLYWKTMKAISRGGAEPQWQRSLMWLLGRCNASPENLEALFGGTDDTKPDLVFRIRTDGPDNEAIDCMEIRMKPHEHLLQRSRLADGREIIQSTLVQDDGLQGIGQYYGYDMVLGTSLFVGKRVLFDLDSNRIHVWQN